MRRAAVGAAFAALLGGAAPLAAQICMGVPPVAPAGVGASFLPSIGASSGGTELGLSAAYAHPAGIGARAGYAATRFGGGAPARHIVGAEVGYEAAGHIPGAPGGLSLCPTLGFERLGAGALTGTSIHAGAAAGGSVALSGMAEWSLHPYGMIGVVRTSRSVEGIRRSQAGPLLRGGVLLGRGRYLAGLEAVHRFTFADDPSFRLRFGVRF